MSATEPHPSDEIVLDTHSVSLDHAPIEDWQSLDGGSDRRSATTTGTAELGHIGGAEFGLWEMSRGSMRDIEGNEVFVVLSGSGRIEFDEPVREPIALTPGTLVRLGDGMRTRWYVDGEPLRKLYIAPGGEAC